MTTKAFAFALLYLAVATFYASSTVRRRVRFSVFEKPASRWTARALGVVAIVAAGWTWGELERSPAPVLVVIVGLMAMGSLVAIVGEVVPRVFRGSVAIALVLAMVFFIGGGLP